MLSVCYQEDAAIHNQDFDSSRHLYGVFDGHGGGEVAKYAKKHYEELLKTIDEYKEGSNLCEAMRKSFLQVDEALKNGGLEEVA